MKKSIFFFGLILTILMSSCIMNIDELLEQTTFSVVHPTFNAGDVFQYNYKIDGVSFTDYYCFTSSSEGKIITHGHTTLNSVTNAENNFSYDKNEGETSVNGDDWLTFIYENNCVKGFNKKDAFIKVVGEKGVFSNGNVKITFKSNGKATYQDSDNEISCNYTNDNGKITLVNSDNSSDKILFYYFSDGYLIVEQAIITFIRTDKIYLYLLLDDSEDAIKNSQYIKDYLPNDFSYFIYHLSKINEAEIETLKNVLNENPKKNFYFESVYYQLLDIDEIPDEYFSEIKNLYGIAFGNVTSPMKIGDRAFKNCTNLEYVRSADSNFCYFGESAFEGCSSLKNIEIYGYDKNKNMTICKNAFKGCSNITYARFAKYFWDVIDSEGVKTKMTEVDTNDATKNTELLTEDYVEYKWLGERSFY